MPTSAATSTKRSHIPLLVGAAVAVGLIAAIFYLNKPAPRATAGSATPEAKAYLANLELNDVNMKASENFMKQQVIEIEGNLGNKGPRPLQSVDVYCLFYAVDSHEIYRERVPVISAKSRPLKPGETRHFRLPFDNLPNGWNQALPKMVVAQIGFAG